MGESQPGRSIWNLTALPRRMERSVVGVSPDMGNLTVSMIPLPVGVAS